MRTVLKQGFTLIEILVVVVIISILTVMGVQMLNSGSVERNLQQHGRILQSALKYACDQATLQNRPYGLKLTTNAYLFSEFANQNWLDLDSQVTLTMQELTDGSFFSLKIDDSSVVLKDEELDAPQIICDAAGQLSNFEILISDNSQKHNYQLKTVDFWHIEGRWPDEK